MNNFQGDVELNFQQSKCIIKDTGEEFSMNDYVSYLKSEGKVSEANEIADVWMKNNNDTYEKQSKMCHVLKFKA